MGFARRPAGAAATDFANVAAALESAVGRFLGLLEILHERASAGERSAPTEVNCKGMVGPAVKSGLFNWNAMRHLREQRKRHKKPSPRSILRVNGRGDIAEEAVGNSRVQGWRRQEARAERERRNTTTRGWLRSVASVSADLPSAEVALGSAP
jgi:hypothetical protein